jgi:type I restriction enzyme S subunit
VTWIRTRVDRVATVNARIGWKALTASEYQPEGYVFLSTPNIKSSIIDFENVNYITAYRYEESPELKLMTGDVLLVKDGMTLGITNVVRQLPRPATVNGSIAVLRPFPLTIEPRFLRYSLAGSVTQGLIQELKDGMDILHLFQRDIKKLPIDLPPLDEQQRIADFLDVEAARIDQLVRLRELQVDRLAEALRSEAGRINPNWQMLPLRRIVDSVQTGTTPAEILLPADPDNVPWYTPTALGGNLDLDEAEKSVSKDDFAAVPRFPAGSILIVGIGESLGKVADLNHAATGNQQLTAIKISNSVDRRFVLWRLFAAQEEIRAWAQYSRVRILNNEVLKSFRIPVPERKEQVDIRQGLDQRLIEFIEFRDAAARFSQLASERRQTLITAAVTGEITI